MDIKALTNKLKQFLQKNKYVALILLIGLILMCLPSGKEKTEETPEIAASPVQQEAAMEEKLGRILGQVAGAGEVQVFLTIASGEQTVYQTNESISHNGDVTNTQSSTVTVTDSKRNQQGLVKQVNPPAYLGAIVVCQGADSPAVRLSVVEAVSKVTGLGSDRISVLKMK